MKPETIPSARNPTALPRLACLGLAVLACVPGLLLLEIIWQRSEYLGHGYLIPVVCTYLIYRQWDPLVQALNTEAMPRMGPLWLLGATLLETGAVVSEIVSLAGVGIPLLLATAAFAVGGWAVLRILAVPIAFLLLMVPPPHFLQDRALIVLTNLVAYVSTEGMQLLGYSVARIGNRILVPGHELFVAETCSGLTSVVTLMPLGVVVALFLANRTWKRVLIVASIVPIALVFNIARVAVTIALVETHGERYAQGLLHDTLGVATFAFGTIVLVLLARLLDR